MHYVLKYRHRRPQRVPVVPAFPSTPYAYSPAFLASQFHLYRVHFFFAFRLLRRRSQGLDTVISQELTAAP